MTTIAVRKDIVAADSWATYSSEAAGSRRHLCAKLFRKTITEGRKTFDVILATAGETSPGLVFVDWYGSGKPPPDTLLYLGGDFTCLILRPDGLWEADAYCRPDRVLDYDRLGYYACGSGTKAAMAAMRCGRSAVEAVRIAAAIDSYTGGRIVSMKLEKNEAKPRRKRSGNGKATAV